MAVLVALLLAGMVALWVSNRSLAQRLETLERRLDAPGRAASADPTPGAPPALRPTSPPPQPRETLGTLFERFVAGRLLIWAGGVALVAAAGFLIRYSIEIGLITPAARMIAAALFGLALMAASEFARAGRGLAEDPRVSQALAGAGLAILFATAYGSYILYALIGPGQAAAAMVAITLAALVLSLRNGEPTAALGLIGGFATPLLVGDRAPGALILLACFALLDLAAFALAWRRGWSRIAGLAVLLSFAWSGWFLLGAPADAAAAGLFVLILALAGSAAPAGAVREAAPAAAVIGAAELAMLAVRSDVGATGLALYGLLSAALLALAAIRPAMRIAPGAALAFALVVLVARAAMATQPFTPQAAIGATLLFGLGGAALAIRMRAAGLAIGAAALAGPFLILRLIQPALLARPDWGLVAMPLAIAALALTWLGQRGAAPDARGPAFFAGAVAALLLAVAAADLAPARAVSIAWLLLAAALLSAGIILRDRAFRLAGLALLTVTAFKVFLIDAGRLEGVWRILSFLGLGIALIGIGRLYGPLLRAEKGAVED